MRKRLFRPAIISLLVLICVAGCGRKSSFDPAEYVKGSMDVLYKKTCSDAYRGMLSEELSQEEIDSVYEQGLDFEVNYFMDVFQITDDSEQLRQKAKSLYGALYEKSRYEMGNVVENNNAYEVDVIIHPIDTIIALLESDAKVYAEQFSSRAYQGEFDNSTEEEFEKIWAEGILELFEQRCSSVGYLDPVTITIRVEKNAEGLFEISEGDFEKIDTHIIAYEK